MGMFKNMLNNVATLFSTEGMKSAKGALISMGLLGGGYSIKNSLIDPKNFSTNPGGKPGANDSTNNLLGIPFGLESVIAAAGLGAAGFYFSGGEPIIAAGLAAMGGLGGKFVADAVTQKTAGTSSTGSAGDKATAAKGTAPVVAKTASVDHQQMNPLPPDAPPPPSKLIAKA